MTTYSSVTVARLEARIAQLEAALREIEEHSPDPHARFVAREGLAPPTPPPAA